MCRVLCLQLFLNSHYPSAVLSLYVSNSKAVEGHRTEMATITHEMQQLRQGAANVFANLGTVNDLLSQSLTCHLQNLSNQTAKNNTKQKKPIGLFYVFVSGQRLSLRKSNGACLWKTKNHLPRWYEI